MVYLKWESFETIENFPPKKFPEMTRGNSLEQDLSGLINNPKYSDIEILCEDEKKLHACRAILAARSEVLNSLLYNRMRESYEKQISFPTINSTVMEIILEYVYIGSIKKESLTKDNIIEALYAAEFFQLLDLYDFIMIKATKKYSPELLSKVVDIMPLTEDNNLLKLLVEKEKPFETPEYEVFRYSVILAVKQVSNETYKIFMKLLPTLTENSTRIDNRSIVNHQEVVKELEPLIEFIDFRRIKAQILVDIIEPLEIIPDDTLESIYRYIAGSNGLSLSNFRGVYIFNESWDESKCGPELVIEDNGKVVEASSNCWKHQNVRAKIPLDDKGIYEWNVIIERTCIHAWVGVCAQKDFYYGIFAGNQPTGWVLGSSGYCWNSRNHCPPFRGGAKITVHLDTSKRSCAFTVNGTKYPEVSSWNNLPQILYPVVSLRSPARLRIQLIADCKKQGKVSRLLNLLK